MEISICPVGIIHKVFLTLVVGDIATIPQLKKPSSGPHSRKMHVPQPLILPSSNLEVNRLDGRHILVDERHNLRNFSRAESVPTASILHAEEKQTESQMHVKKQAASGGELSPSAAAADRHTDARRYYVFALMLPAHSCLKTVVCVAVENT